MDELLKQMQRPDQMQRLQLMVRRAYFGPGVCQQRVVDLPVCVCGGGVVSRRDERD